jgi:hypothetical protein
MSDKRDDYGNYLPEVKAKLQVIYRERLRALGCTERTIDETIDDDDALCSVADKATPPDLPFFANRWGDYYKEGAFAWWATSS